MAKYQFVTGCILLALMLMVTMVSAAELKADLNVTKVVSSTGPYAINDTVTWVVTVSNNGPDDATNVTLKEDISQLSGHGDINVEVSNGAYDSATGTWTIAQLENATSEYLTLVTNFSTAGEKTNKVTVTLNETDENLSDNSHESGVNVFDKLLLSADLKIKPTTLNVNSNGVFTVYVTLNTSGSTKDGAKKPTIDFAQSSLTCSEAELIRAAKVSNKDGGTLIAKFSRQELRNVTNGTGVMVNCSGTLSVDGESIYVEGSDTIRVIGEKKGLDKIFSDLKKFLGVEKDEVEINETENSTAASTVTLNPDSYKNNGQLKKQTGNSDDQSVKTTVTRDLSDKTRGPKEDAGKNSDNDKNLQKNNAGDTTGSGNNKVNRPDDESPGKSNVKNTK
ncbi:MAG: DUF11 domain-containing protein [Methanoregula sp.]|nr:DUF11 domain-containing protein [Methanoregula sp.]